LVARKSRPAITLAFEYDETTNRYRLLRGRNPQKDQSYFLWELTQDQLSARAVFPWARCPSRSARSGAAESTGSCRQEESQEICFVPDGDYAGFIDRYLEAEDAVKQIPGRGDLVDRGARLLALMKAFIATRWASDAALASRLNVRFMCYRIDVSKNQVTVERRKELLGGEFTAAGVNWISLDSPTEPVRAEVRIRYRHEAAPATITPVAEGRVRVSFDEPQRAITPGQATVFYRGDEVVGGGWIVK